MIPCALKAAKPGTLSFSVKVKEDIRHEIRLAKENIIEIGIPSVDVLNRQYKCTEMKRVFKGPFDAVTESVGLDRIFHLTFRTDESINSIIEKYRATRQFDYVTSYKTFQAMGLKAVKPDDKYYYRQWALHNDGTYNMSGLYTPKAGADIDMQEAWEIEKGDSTIIIGIIDSGCKLNHKELAGRIWKNPGEIPGNNKDDDNNGYIDDVNGWNFADTNNNVDDQHGHGTGIAGIIGANCSNTLGLAGVNWHSKLMITKVTDSKAETLGYAYPQAIKYCVDNGVNIINFSSAGYDPGSPLEEDAILYAYKKNVLFVTGVGNKDTSSIAYPASNQYTLAVGATGPDDTRVVNFINKGGKSSYGAGIDIVAPGNYIVVLSITDDNNYLYVAGGTSCATAYTTGVASLLLSLNPQLTPDQLKTILSESAEDQVGDPKEDIRGWDKYYGHGRLNAYKALLNALAPVSNQIQHIHHSAQVQITHKNNVLTFMTEGLSEWIHVIEIVALNGRKIYTQNDIYNNCFQNTLRIHTHGISSQQVVFRLKGLDREVNGVVTLR